MGEVIDLYSQVLHQAFDASAEMLLGGGAEKLESALGRPEQHAHYLGSDLAQQAAVLAHGIVEAHAFRDGNKRVALAALYAFLRVSGYTAAAPKRRRVTWMIALATGASAEEVADEIREYLAPLP